jgi:hypothetical protein
MIYKGKEIKDKEYVLVEEEPFLEYSSNYVEFDLEDLEDLCEKYKAKEKELKDSGLDFKDLTIEFWAQDYEYNPNGADWDDEAKLYFTYKRLETEKESEDRILREMDRIDRQAKEDARMKDAEEAVKNYELEKARKLLEANGYTINK